eukprot:scaffold10066_cov208-Isochrysis_galbana.AAC.1
MPMFKVKRPSILSRTASVKAHAPAGASAASSAASQRQLSEIAEQRAQQQQQHEKTLRIVEEAHQEALRVEKAAHIEAIRIEKAVHQGLQEDVLEASRSIDALVAEVAELRAQLEVAEEARRRAEATAAISRAEIGTAEAAVGAAEAAAAAADVSRKQAQAEAARIAIAARAATTLVSRDASVVSSARRAGPNEEITFLAPRALLPPPSAAAPPVEPAVDSHPAVLVEPDVPTAEHGFVLPPLQTTLTEWEMIFEDQRVTWLKYFMVTGQYAEAMELVVSDAEAAAVHEFRSRPALKRAVERNLGLAIPSHTAPSGPAEGRPPSPRVSLVHTRAMPGYAASVSASRAANEAVPSRNMSMAGSTLSSLYSSFNDETFADYDAVEEHAVEGPDALIQVCEASLREAAEEAEAVGAVEEADQAVEEADQAVEEADQAVEEADQAVEEADQAVEEADQAAVEEADQAVEEADQAVEEADQA